MYVMDIYDGDRRAINLGPIIPDTPALYFYDEGTISILLPLGAPPSSIDRSNRLRRWRLRPRESISRHLTATIGFRRPTSESGKRFPAEPFTVSQGFYAG